VIFRNYFCSSRHVHPSIAYTESVWGFTAVPQLSRGQGKNPRATSAVVAVRAKGGVTAAIQGLFYFFNYFLIVELFERFRELFRGLFALNFFEFVFLVFFLWSFMNSFLIFIKKNVFK